MRALLFISILGTFFVQAQNNYCLVEQGARAKGTTTLYEAYCLKGQEFSSSTSIFLSAFSKKKLAKKYRKLFNDLMDEAAKYDLQVIASLKNDHDSSYNHIILSDNLNDDVDYCYGISWNVSKVSKKGRDRHTLYCNEKTIFQTSDLAVLKEYLVFKGYSEAASFELSEEYKSLHVFEKSKY